MSAGADADTTSNTKSRKLGRKYYHTDSV